MYHGAIPSVYRLLLDQANSCPVQRTAVSRDRLFHQLSLPVPDHPPEGRSFSIITKSLIISSSTPSPLWGSSNSNFRSTTDWGARRYFEDAFHKQPQNILKHSCVKRCSLQASLPFFFLGLRLQHQPEMPRHILSGVLLTPSPPVHRHVQPISPPSN